MSDRVGLNVFVAGYGYHEAAWRFADLGERATPGLEHFAAVARVAERGALDALFLADSPGVAPFRARFMAQAGYDPIDLLAALVPTTERIGLLATASTTYSSPWDLARRFASLDHVSNGRAGWNIVTTGSPVAAPNFADRPHPPHADRYARAREFVDVVQKVWDGWDDDALLASSDTGVWADGARLHPPAHRGEHYSVAGILPLPRSPQGHPLLAQAGSSNDGVDLAARVADVVFTPQPSLERSAQFRARLHEAARGHGRDPAHVRLWPGLSFVLGATEAEATAAWDALEGAASEEFRLANLTHIAGVPPELAATIDPDGPFPFAVFERASSTTFAAAVTKVARDTGLSFRRVAHHFSTLPGGLHVTGTPEQLADLIVSWFRAGAADGFTLQPLRLPLDLELFVDHVVPRLRAAGVTTDGYPPGATLRERLGLPRPAPRR